MRNLFKFSIFFSVLAGLLALYLHLRSITGVWAGMPYRADVMTYPYVGLDRWAVGAACIAVTCVVYAVVLSMLIKDKDLAEEIRRFDSLKVLNGK